MDLDKILQDMGEHAKRLLADAEKLNSNPAHPDKQAVEKLLKTVKRLKSDLDFVNRKSGYFRKPG